MKLTASLFAMTLVGTSLVTAGCTESASGTRPEKRAATPAIPAAPTTIHTRSATPQAVAGLYYGDQLLVNGVTDAIISPDGTQAVWQDGEVIKMYALKQHQARVITSEIPSPLVSAEWLTHTIRLKLANTGEILVDNVE